MVRHWRMNTVKLPRRPNPAGSCQILKTVRKDSERNPGSREQTPEVTVRQPRKLENDHIEAVFMTVTKDLKL